ncbi:MAG: hypothetical protein ACK4Y8_07880, partial [Bacteroidota bacterium]
TQQSNQKINNLSIDRYATVLAPQILESHLVPTTIDLAAITPSKQLQEDFMKQRFNLLKNSISQELTALLR